jgi:UPF0755 protein
MRKSVVYILLVILVLFSIVLWQIFGPNIKNPDKRFLFIRTNSSYAQVKDSLLKDGFIKGDFWFNKIADYVDYTKNIKPGKYRVSNGMSVYHLVKMLRSGNQVPVNLIITKLRTKEDLAKKISRSFETDSATVIHFLNNNDSLSKFDVDSNTVMTVVIPNTYTYTWTTSLGNIFKKLYAEEKIFWNQDRMAKAQKLQLTPKQVYIMASIVEEETNKQDDKSKIASVYLNRMKKGMRLAADPTIKFAMKDFELKRIYHKYLQYPSPYNTYLNSGLPPGPICTPSIKTIDAVLDAPETDYLFFVARADFSGFSDFAATYQEHLVYAKAYQQALNNLIKERQENQTDTAN